MREIFKRRKHVVSISILFLLLLAFRAPVSAQETAPRVVRVAFPQVPGLSQTAEDGSRHGMMVDYLNEIAKYNNWTYEYVDTTGETMLDEFLNGDYELMGGAYYMPALEEYYAYPEYNMGYSRSTLLARSDDRSIHSFDLESMNGKTIGVYERAAENIRRLQNFLTVSSIDCTLRYYSYEELGPDGKLYSYLESGEVDMILGNVSDTPPNARVVAFFNSQPYYIVTNIGNQEILDGLNMALERILDTNPNFANERFAANFPDRLVDVQMDNRDLDYIREKGSVTVALPRDWHPLYCAEQHGEFHAGIVDDVLSEVAAFTGLEFRYLLTDTYTDAIRLVQQGDADILGFFPGGEDKAAELGMTLSAHYVSLNNLLVRNKAVSYPDAGAVGTVLEGQDLPSSVTAAQVRSFPTTAEALQAADRGEVDFVFGLSSQLEQDIQRYRFSNLIPVSLPDEQSSVCFALRRPVDPDLLTVINKAINSLSASEKDAIQERNTVSIGVISLSFTDFIYSHPIQFIAIAAGILLALAVVVLMVTRARLKAAAIQADLERAEVANRAKSEFLSRMSHEIRTPLSGILGMSAIAMQNLDSSAKVADCLEKVTTSSNHLLALVNDVLDMSKVESGKVELQRKAFDLQSFLETLEDLYAGQAQSKNIRYEVFLDGTADRQLLGDPLRTSQILSNLLSNAIKFTPEGGVVTLRVSTTVLEEDTIRLRFQVKDTGCGIAAENFDKIFESFEQESVDVASNYGGTGLGLSIVRRFTGLMGGNVSVDSAQGVGSTFTVEIPFDRVSVPESLTEYRPRGGFQWDSNFDFKGKRILLAEDNELNREIAIELLLVTGATVETAEDGCRAVEQFQTSAVGYYDLVLMDIMMPEMDGYEATRVIRALDRPDARTVPIVAMTANAFAEDEARSRNAGMNAHISKPLDIKLLYTTLEKLFKSGDPDSVLP